MAVDQGEQAQREVESVAGGLGPSESGAGIVPTQTACGQGSELASAPAPTHDSSAAKSKNPASGPATGEPAKKRRRRPKKSTAAAAAPGEDAEVAALTQQLGALPLADAPAMCYSFVICKLKGCTPAEATGFLTAAYQELRGEHERAGRDYTYLATLEAGTFHHNVAERVLRRSGQRFQRVFPADYGRLHSRKKSTFVVYGKLNIAGFDPCAGNKSAWIPKCRANGFYGLAPIEGEVNHDYHVVIVQNGAVHCMNLEDEQGRPFSLSATTVLPLTNLSRDGQRRIKASNTHAYLANISRVFEVADAPAPTGAAAAQPAPTQQRGDEHEPAGEVAVSDSGNDGEMQAMEIEGEDESEESPAHSGPADGAVGESSAEESTTGPPRRQRSGLADDAAMSAEEVAASEEISDAAFEQQHAPNERLEQQGYQVGSNLTADVRKYKGGRGVREIEEADSVMATGSDETETTENQAVAEAQFAGSGLKVEGHPLAYYNGVYRVTAEHDGWPVMKNANGRFCYYYAEQNCWFLWKEFTPEKTTCKAYIAAAADGTMPMGGNDWRYVDETLTWGPKRITTSLV